MAIKWQQVNRKVHFWGSIICAIPILIVIGSGVLLLLKKESEWIQPPTIKGQSKIPTLSFDKILTAVQSVEETNIEDWKEIKRLDVRPSKGVIKIQTADSWEIQLDHQSGEVLHVAFRRSDIIEAIHDGSFFHDTAKLGVFLPASIILFVLWVTGIYLFTKTLIARDKTKKKRLAKAHTNAQKAKLLTQVSQGLPANTLGK